MRAYVVRRVTSIGLLSVALVACVSEDQLDLPPPPKIETLAELRDELAGAGVPVSPALELSAPELRVAAESMFVGTAPVHAYEYGSRVERRLVSDTIRAGGYLVGGEPVDWPARPNIWAKGQLIVVYPGVDGGTLLLLSGLLGDPLTSEAPTVDEPYPPAVLVTIGAAAQAVGLSPEDIQVMSYDFMEWPDGCLGLPAPDEMCTEAIVPGWLVRLNAAGEQIVFRADEVGVQVRQE